MGWQSLRRNWHVAIVGLLVTVCLVGVAYKMFPAKYVTTSQIVLLPPRQASADNGIVNPYMGLAGLQSMADVISSAMMDDETAKVLKESGVTNYSVQYDTLVTAPILIVQATESSPTGASAAIAVLDKQVPLTVTRLQKEASIAPKSFIAAKVIARPSTPAKAYKTEIRAVGLAFVVGLVLTLLAISLINAWRIRRRMHGSSARHSDEHADAIPAFARPNSISQPDLAWEQNRAPRAHREPRIVTPPGYDPDGASR
jgi:hypothetical protein